MRSTLRWTSGALVWFALCVAQGAAQTQADFFDETVLHEIRLEMRPSDWDTLKQHFLENTYYPADFKWKNILVEDIAIRSRGTGSRSPVKPGLRIDFDRNEPDQTFLGLKSVVLRGNTQEPSMMHERLSMKFMLRMGLYASREASTKFYVNNEYIGLYTIVETVDKNFLKRSLGEDEGYLYKYDYNAGDAAYYFGSRGADPNLYSPSPFKPETHEKDPDPKPLGAMIVSGINGSADADFTRVMADYMDLKYFMKHVAVERFLGEQDGIIGGFGMNNFYMYRYNKKNLNVVLAWDKSNAFESGPTETIWRFVTDVPAAQQNVLMRRALAVPELRQAYLDTLVACARLAGTGSNGFLSREIDFEYNQTRDAAYADKNKQKQDPRTGLLIPSSNADFEAEVVALRNFAAKRSDSVLDQVSKELKPVTERQFTFVDKGGVSVSTLGTSSSGYARIQPASGNTAPAGLAIFGLKANGVVVSEAGVPASPLVTSGRIYAEVNSPVDTGLAIANPNSQAATITYFYTDSTGKDTITGTTTIPANSQIAEFLDQSRFNSGPSFSGTFTFTSNVPVSAIALRGLNNERNDFLITTLPVSPLSAPAGETVIFPNFSDGGGWTTQVVLVNPTDETISGTVQFLGQGSASSAGQPVSVTIDGQTASTFVYSIASRTARRLLTSGRGSSTQSGWVRVVPDSGRRSPSGLAIFSYKTGGVTVSEAGVPASPATTAVRMYAEVSGDAVDTGVALSNSTGSAIPARVELTDLAGKALAVTGNITVPANGQVALFLDQVSGFEKLPTPFQGIARISTTSASGMSVVGLRSRLNERGDFLITTTPPVDEKAAPGSAEQLFPHLADSGGYTTQFILYSGAAGQAATGTLRFVAQSGQALSLLIW
jgi:hypothetical protein